MNVLELCLSPGYGGLEMYPHKILTWLPEMGVACTAVVAPGTMLASRLQEAGLSYRLLSVRSRLFPFIAAKQLARIIDDEAIDVLHIHWSKDLNLGVLAKRMSRRPVRLVYTRQMAITRSKYDLYHRRLYRHVDRFIVITRKLRDEAREYLPLPSDRIALLYYGVERPASLGPAECGEFLRAHQLDGPGIKVASFGRIEHIKGQHLLIEALGRLSQKGCPFQAALVGRIMDQAYFDRLMTRAEDLGLTANLRYLGFLDRPAEAMGCFDVVILTTYGETFGLVLAEAMRAGVAVIGSNAGGVPEIIEDAVTGLLFEPGDAQGLAAAIERMVEEPALRDRVARSGRRFAEATFAVDVHVQGLIGIFEAVLKESE